MAKAEEARAARVDAMRIDEGNAPQSEAPLYEAIDLDAAMELIRKLVRVVERQAEQISELTQRWQELSAAVETITEGLRCAVRVQAKMSDEERTDVLDVR